MRRGMWTLLAASILPVPSGVAEEPSLVTVVEVDGKPFVISVSRSPALPVSKEPGFVPPAYFRLAEALADAMVDIYSTTEKAVF